MIKLQLDLENVNEIPDNCIGKTIKIQFDFPRYDLMANQFYWKIYRRQINVEFNAGQLTDGH